MKTKKVKADKTNNLKSITLRANYKIENMPCCHKDFDIWDDFKDYNDFKFCPFCNRELGRTINIPKNSIIGYDYFEKSKYGDENGR